MEREETVGSLSGRGEYVWERDMKCNDSDEESKVEEDEVAEKSDDSVILISDTSDEEWRVEEDNESDGSVIQISGILDVEYKVEEDEIAEKSDESLILISGTSDEESRVGEDEFADGSDDSVILISDTSSCRWSKQLFNEEEGDGTIIGRRVFESKALMEGSSPIKDVMNNSSKKRKISPYDVDEDYNVEDEYYDEDDDLDSSDEEVKKLLCIKGRVTRSGCHTQEIFKSNHRRMKRNKLTSSGNNRNHPKTSPTSRRKHRRLPGRPKKNTRAWTNSDCTSSESSDCEYITSEEEDDDEEGEEEKEAANKICRQVKRITRSSKQFLEDVICNQQPGTVTGSKGKEKMGSNIDSDVEKPHVCGICFTEEGRDKVRGTMNCCSHYFCFDCIIEWSKIESRCPLCKQRFSTIKKPAGGSPLVIHVPVRDQVYQPSDEELVHYIEDLFDNMNCTVCNEGGDDALMLLCDICNSPAHTYCVGLGHEVPEGSWYCEGCRPTVPETTSSDPMITQQQVPILVEEPSSTTENVVQIDFMSSGTLCHVHEVPEGNMVTQQVPLLATTENVVEIDFLSSGTLCHGHKVPESDLVIHQVPLLAEEPSSTTENRTEIDFMSKASTCCPCGGLEAPGGNLYCEDSRATSALQTSCSLSQYHTPGENSVSNEPSSTTENMAEIDLNVSIINYETPASPFNGFLSLLTQVTSVTDRFPVSAGRLDLLGSQMDRGNNEAPYHEHTADDMRRTADCSFSADQEAKNLFGSRDNFSKRPSLVSEALMEFDRIHLRFDDKSLGEQLPCRTNLVSPFDT